MTTKKECENNNIKKANKEVAPLGRLKNIQLTPKTRERRESLSTTKQKTIRERDLEVFSNQCLLSLSSIVFLTTRSPLFSSHWFALFTPFDKCRILLVTYDCF